MYIDLPAPMQSALSDSAADDAAQDLDLDKIVVEACRDLEMPEVSSSQPQMCWPGRAWPALELEEDASGACAPSPHLKLSSALEPKDASHAILAQIPLDRAPPMPPGLVPLKENMCSTTKKFHVQEECECQCDGEASVTAFKNLPQNSRGQGHRTRDSSKVVDEQFLMSTDKRWWTKLGQTLFCPLTNFPIHLLPYPPFKFRMDPDQPAPNKLIDGKFLAMKVIVNGQCMVCGRKMEAEDMAALDEHIHRCKLGVFRPGRAWALMQEALSPSVSQDRRKKAAKELHRITHEARMEMRKIRRIQDNRLVKISKHIRKQQQQHTSTMCGSCRHPSFSGAEEVLEE